jgi:uncharacterized protein YwgA
MNAFAINTNLVPLPVLSSSNALTLGYKGSFFITSEMDHLEIQNGNAVLFIKAQNDDLRFTNNAIISSIGNVDVIKPSDNDIKRHKGSLKPKDTYRHHYSFVVNQQLKSNNLLSELEYSLPIIYNFHKPKVHFQQQYRALQKNDYDTITNGWIYATRTVFGKMVNAIPRQNKLEFMLRAIDNFSTIDFSKVPLMDGLEFLHEYIDTRILSRGRILVATNNLIQKKLSDLVPPDEIGFINPNNEQSNKISAQAKIFEDLFSLEKKHDLKQSLKLMIQQKSEQEERFEKIFSRQTWPIDLSV